MENDKHMLVLGGTQMVGRDFVELCMENNIYPDLANRGLTNKNLFPYLNWIKLDREDIHKCQLLRNKYYDTIIDFSCYNINHFLNIIQTVSFHRYIFISTLAVFGGFEINDPLYSYGQNKKEIENLIISTNIKNVLIFRPCVLYGSNDYTNRFYEENNIIYWKHNNQRVYPDHFHSHVRNFSKCLLENINFDTSIRSITFYHDTIETVKNARSSSYIR